MELTELTAQRLRELVSYEPETGVFTALVARHKVKVGDVVGTPRPDGYCRLRIDRVRYLVHRLAWLYMTGEWPKEQIDHIDGDPSNNRWRNLRECSNSQNCQNRSTVSAGKHRNHIGVWFRADRGCWAAKITAHGVVHRLGHFGSEAEAIEAYLHAKREFHTFQPTLRNQGAAVPAF